MTTQIFRISVRRVLASAAVGSALLTLGCGNVKDDLLAAEDPDIIPPLIHYVEVFVPEHSGKHYSTMSRLA